MQWRLGETYLHAKEYGLANYPFLMAARWHFVRPRSRDWKRPLSLGLIYLNGTGLEKDPREAAKWFRMAAGTRRRQCGVFTWAYYTFKETACCKIMCKRICGSI